MPDVMFLRSCRGVAACVAAGLSFAFALLPQGFAADTTARFAQQQIKAEPPSPVSKPSQRVREEAQLRLLLGDMSKPVGPSEEALAPVREKMGKEIKVQFLDTPFERVIDFIRRESGVTILIDRRSTGGRETGSVALEAEKMTLKEALDWACMVTDTDWDVIKGVVVISTSTAIQRRQTVTKVYDIRGLVIQVPNFTGAPDFDLNSALSNTSSGGSGGGVQFTGTLFSDDGTSGEQPTRTETIGELITLVQDTVGNQADWAAYGGEISSVREITGNLIVRTTPANHKQIQTLFDQMAQGREKMVSVDARYYLIKSKVLDDLIKKNEGEFIIPADKLEGFLKAAADPATGVKRLGAARLAMFNGQRTHLTAANAMSFLSDVEPVSGGEGFDPTQSVLLSGARIDVEATVTQNGKSIVMTFRGEVTTGVKLRQTDIPGSSGNSSASEHKQGGRITGTVTPRDNTKPIGPDNPAAPGTPGILEGNITNTTTTIKPARQGGAPTAAALDLPDQDGVSYRTSVAIPNGGAVLLTGASTMIKSLPTEDAEIVLIVTARSK